MSGADSIGTPGGSPERPAIFFEDAAQFRAWLEANHDTATELWMGIYKKHVAQPGLTWADAVPEALCFGWIDSVSQRIDDDARRQRWTPRRPQSIWSNVNIAHVERLKAEGRMHPAGLAAYERRTEDRTAVYSHENPDVRFSPEHQQLLAASAAASAFWAVAPKTYQRAIINWVCGAKREETRDRRMTQLIDDCAAGRLVPFQRYGTPPAWLRKAAAAAADTERS